jgi:hypothetical protein
MYWDKGVAHAPKVVQTCIRSWRLQNPEYEVRVLDDSTVGAWVDLAALLPHYRELAVQKRSNLLRLELLRRYGGVWADATCYSAIPLREWIPAELPEGFLAKANPRRNMFVSNWFIAATPGARFIDLWQLKYVEFLGQTLRHRPSRIEREFLRLIERHVARTPQSTSLWCVRLPSRVLRTYPYFIHMYLANEVIVQDQMVAAAWARRPYVDFNSKLVRHKDPAKSTSSALQMLDSRSSPIYKLSWKKGWGAKEMSQVFGRLVQILDDVESTRRKGAGDLATDVATIGPATPSVVRSAVD